MKFDEAILVDTIVGRAASSDTLASLYQPDAYGFAYIDHFFGAFIGWTISLVFVMRARDY